MKKVCCRPRGVLGRTPFARSPALWMLGERAKAGHSVPRSRRPETAFAARSGSTNRWTNVWTLTGPSRHRLLPPRPGYQDGVAGISRGRGVPDVAADANDAVLGEDFDTNFTVVEVSGGLPFVRPAGGTSAF